MRGINHGARIAAIWLVASIIVEFLLTIAPIPVPTASVQALGIRQTMYMLFLVGAPIFVFIWVMLIYSFIMFRRRPGETSEPTPRPDSTPLLLIWAGISFVIVLFLAGWGTFTLHEITQANGPRVLPIQVIGQQWFWSFRYPTYGAMETGSLVVPVNTPIRFDITSLDVVHSFWIYNYDVKEDAVPGVQTTAYFDTDHTGKVLSVCNELCGLWHGYMHTGVRVVSKAAFASWASHQLAYEKSTGFLKNLPKYAPVYYPSSNSNWPPPPQDQSP